MVVRTTFAAGEEGAWRVRSIDPICGTGLAPAPRLAVYDGPVDPARPCVWSLEAVQSHHRYLARGERDELRRTQAPLGRPAATRAALIPISKSAAWWELAQDERREIFEERSRHVSASMPYVAAIARRLYHARDLGGPFDFLTWFEFAPEDEPRFDELVAMLRSTPEWGYVEREVDLRLERAAR